MRTHQNTQEDCVQVIQNNESPLVSKPLVRVILQSDIRMGKWVGKPGEQELRRRLTFTNPER
jgi:hypothetical protein